MVWAAVAGAGMAALGVGQQIVGRKAAAEAAEQQSEWNAEMAREDIKVVQLQSNLEQANLRRAFAAHGASMEAKTAASGARVGVGSPALALVQNARGMAEQEAIAQLEEESAVRRLETGATMTEIQGQLAASSQRRAMATDVIQGATQITGMFI